MGTQVMWFKRDLRVEDDAPLHQASKCGLCICLYVYETKWLTSEEFDASHLQKPAGIPWTLGIRIDM